MQTRKCYRCERQMVTITLEIGGEEKTLRSCSNCDIREWETNDGGETLDGVLDELAAASGH